MKGIILAGGSGSRLWPLTKTISKQLLPIYDKPLIYYPLSTLMLAGIRDILIITSTETLSDFQSLLGDGSDWGISLNYAIQENPEGLAQAYTIAEEFLDQDYSLMILGDNVFHGSGLGSALQNELDIPSPTIFTYEVSDPSAYGVLTVDAAGIPLSIEEKPKNPKSNLAITGLYLFDGKASEYARKIKKSPRGEYEITSLIEFYLQSGQLKVTHLNRGTAWLDTGNPNHMHDASTYIRVIEERTGLKIGCPEEIALNLGFIDQQKLTQLMQKMGKNAYSKYLEKIISVKQ